MNPRAATALLLPLSIIAALALLLTVLLLAGRMPDDGLSSRIQAELGEYTLHDTELSRDVMLVRSGLLPNYDALAADRAALTDALGRLQDELARASEASRSRLAGALADLGQVQQTRLVAVEHFKSNNALLRNSLLYFAYVGPTLRLPLQRQALAAELGRLSYAVLSFLQSPDASVEGEIQALLDRIDETGHGQSDLHSLVEHGRLLVRVLPLVDAQLRAIHEAPVDAHVEALRDAVRRNDALGEHRAQEWRWTLYAVSLSILLCLAWAWLRLRARVRELRDAADQMRRQRLQLVNSSGLVLLGTHLAGVAHDLRTPVQAVGSSATQLMQLWPGLREALDERALSEPGLEVAGMPWASVREVLLGLPTDLKAQADALLGLAGLLLELARPPTGRAEPIDVNAVVASSLRLVRHAIDERTHAFRFEPGGHLPPALADPRALGLVLLNLINNALESLPSADGAVSVRTRRGASGQVVIEVEDEGSGIAPEHRARLFEPFFTTKAGRNGTGLGLSLSRAALEGMGGNLRIEPAPVRGTRAVVTLQEAPAP